MFMSTKVRPPFAALEAEQEGPWTHPVEPVARVASPPLGHVPLPVLHPGPAHLC